jgi:hypothetical protein
MRRLRSNAFCEESVEEYLEKQDKPENEEMDEEELTFAERAG